MLIADSPCLHPISRRCPAPNGNPGQARANPTTAAMRRKRIPPRGIRPPEPGNPPNLLVVNETRIHCRDGLDAGKGSPACRCVAHWMLGTGVLHAGAGWTGCKGGVTCMQSGHGTGAGAGSPACRLRQHWMQDTHHLNPVPGWAGCNGSITSTQWRHAVDAAAPCPACNARSASGCRRPARAGGNPLGRAETDSNRWRNKQ